MAVTTVTVGCAYILGWPVSVWIATVGTRSFWRRSGNWLTFTLPHLLHLTNRSLRAHWTVSVLTEVPLSVLRHVKQRRLLWRIAGRGGHRPELEPSGGVFAKACFRLKAGG